MKTWPVLEYANWRDTLQTLHRWTQVVGKIKVSFSPWANHSWNSALYVTARGLTTSSIYEKERAFQIDFDLVDHALKISFDDRKEVVLPLRSESVASFHDRCIGVLNENNLKTVIHEQPNEVPDTIRLCDDLTHQSYDPIAVSDFFQALHHADRLMKIFRAGFLGKASPVHFFWGSFDLAVTRFSGRKAPEHPGGIPHLPDLITREGYSHELMSCGFWPGNDQYPHAAFYGYAYPAPAGFDQVRIPVKGAEYHPQLKEFLLPYRLVRKSRHPDQEVLKFFQSIYTAAAELGYWNRDELEKGIYFEEMQRLHSRQAG